ncbi:hypothetical protein ASF65_20490 [Aureimonas sp. Leaf324]|nr:hypothetical protein ASF65_20490 [Aureimonas sp. Leaf324]
MDAKALQEAVALRFEVEKLAALLATERERIVELREDREHWREQAQRLALTHEKAAIIVPPAPSAPEVRPGLLARLAAAVRG